MNEDFIKEQERKYGEYKQCNLPTPFFDEGHESLEYICAKDNNKKGTYYYVSRSITDSLRDIANVGFEYNFNCSYFRLSYIDEDDTPKKVYCHMHTHNFEEVVMHLYDFPESFFISDKDKVDYSVQELRYLNRVKKYLLFIGLKDVEESFNYRDEAIKSNNKYWDRFNNTKHEQYKDCAIEKLSNIEVDEIISGKKKYIAFVPYDINYYKKEDVIKNRKALIIDENDDFKLLIKYTNCEIKDLQDPSNRDLYNTDNYIPDNKVVVKYFEVLERF